MAGIADIRESLAGTESIQAALRAARLPEESWRKSLTGTGAIDKAMRDLNAQNAIAQINLRAAYDVPRFESPPRFEETPMGRATLESVDHSRHVAEKMDSLVVVVAGLNQTMVQDVLPAWFNKIEEDQRAAKGAIDQAARGLRWTKWAVIASVFVTIAATWWQVDVAKSIDHESSVQQRRVEAVLREQLSAQQRLLDQQARDAAAMREFVATLKQPVPIAKRSRQNGG